MRNLYQLLLELEWIVEDIEYFSVQNDDVYNAEIHTLHKNALDLKNKVKHSLKSIRESEEA